MEEVFEFAKKVYADKKRSTGELFIDHVASVALLLHEWGLDQKTIAAGTLHDAANPEIATTKEDALKNIRQAFGDDIATLVEKVSDINKIYYSFADSATDETFLHNPKTENLRKMFLAIASDVRVVLIELAARVDGLQKMASLPADRQKSYAMEALEVFAPIANRLGLGEIKRTIEDLAFEFLFPEKFRWLKEHIKEKYEERQSYLKKFIPHFKKVLKHERIPFLDINFRAKSYFSTYQKLQRHNMDLEKIYDLVAIRLIVKDIAACYKVLGIIHKYYQPMSGQIQDYIAKPKDSGYQSIHTTVFTEPGKISEIQIKTDQMNKEAEYGICAHWAYKEKINLKKNQEHLALANKIPEFLETFKIDFYSRQVFAFTPKRDIIVLPKGATPVDFAYAIHSDVGNHCEAAKISGKIIPLSQELKNGDIVEIITNKKRNPSQDWLRFVKTGFARTHIKKIILSIPASIFYVPSLVTKKIFEISKKARERKEEKQKIKKQESSQIYLAGQKGMLVNFAKCCNPQVGDQSRAYVTRYRAAVLHKISCQNLQKLSQKFPEKVIDASWQKS